MDPNPPSSTAAQAMGTYLSASFIRNLIAPAVLRWCARLTMCSHSTRTWLQMTMARSFGGITSPVMMMSTPATYLWCCGDVIGFGSEQQLHVSARLRRVGARCSGCTALPHPLDAEGGGADGRGCHEYSRRWVFVHRVRTQARTQIQRPVSCGMLL